MVTRLLVVSSRSDKPKAAGGEILGEKAYASLAEIPFPVDIVNVYRRSEFLPDVARDFLKADAKIFGHS